MKQFINFLCPLLLTIVCACSQKDAAYMEAASYDAAFAGSGSVAEELRATSEDAEITDSNIAIQRKIIKEGSIRFETTDVEKTREVILNSVRDNSGYLSNDNATNYSGRTDYYLTIRIPADKFDTVLTQISRTAKKIDSKDIKALDVTEEFIDIEARIKTKKEIENRYRELLRQAHTVSDVLAVEKEIGILRSDIESFEGRLKYLKDRVAYSTLTVIFYEKEVSASSYSFGFGDKFVNALINGWTNILWFIIGLTNLWPFILIIVIGIILIKRIRKNRKKRQTKNNSPS